MTGGWEGERRRLLLAEYVQPLAGVALVEALLDVAVVLEGADGVPDRPGREPATLDEALLGERTLVLQGLVHQLRAGGELFDRRFGLGRRSLRRHTHG